MKRLLFFFAIILAFTALHILAQDPAYQPRPDQARPDQAGPGPENELGGGPENDPSRGVARISLLNGEVSVRRGDSGDVVAAALNAPLVSQDRLLTSSSSRTEVQFDSGNMLRIGSNSEVRLNEVQQRRFQVQIAAGTVTFRVIRNSQSEVEIDTPSVSFRPLRAGSYRVTVHEDGSTEISVRDGEAEIFGPRGTERLRAGVTVLARGSADDPEFREVAPIGLDEWDRWNQSRDRQLESSRSYDYVSPDVAGAEDLEGYGRWANDPQYGNVWVPRVEPGWAPYRSGRWVWEDYYGWTWVSYDPWGWAPYHYGRWYSGSLGWAWYPGPRYSHQYWSPALVAFFGFGGYGGFHSGVGFGFGNVGWVPLAPYERCHPWWGREVYRGFGGDHFGGNRGFGNNTTIVNNTNITNIYRNARVNNAITAVGANDFGRHTGQFVGMSGASVRDAGLVRGVLPVTPDRSSLRLADRQVRAAAFPQDRNINFAGRRSSPQTRVPFDQQQRGMDQVARQTFGAGRRNGGAGFSSGGNGGTVQGQGANQGWRRSGDPGRSTDPGPQQQGAQPQNPQGGFSQRGGNTGAATHEWRRFGEPIHGSVQDTGGRTSPAQTYSGTNSSYGRSTVDRGVDRGNYPQSQPDSGSNGAASWHRFGQPSTAGGPSYQTAPQASGQRSYYDNGGARRLGGSSAYQTIPQAPIAPAPPTTYQPYSQPAHQYNAPRDYGRGSSSQPVRISPPMIRERSAPSMDYSRGGSSGYHSVSGGGGSRSAPQSSNGGGHQNSGGGDHSSSSNNNNSGRSGGRR